MVVSVGGCSSPLVYIVLSVVLLACCSVQYSVCAGTMHPCQNPLSDDFFKSSPLYPVEKILHLAKLVHFVGVDPNSGTFRWMQHYSFLLLFLRCFLLFLGRSSGCSQPCMMQCNMDIAAEHGDMRQYVPMPRLAVFQYDENWNVRHVHSTLLLHSQTSTGNCNWWPLRNYNCFGAT